MMGMLFTVQPMITSVIAAAATLFLMSEIRAVAAQDDQQCSEYQFTPPFYPGSSCQDIYDKNPESRDKPGYYWVTDGPSDVYCGMNYTGLDCEEIYASYEAVRDRSGYYRITNNEWVYCNMTAAAFSYDDLITSCPGVGGVWRRIANLNVTAGDDCPSPWVNNSHDNVSFCRIPSDNGGCYSVIYPTNERYDQVCGRASGYQKGSPDGFRNFTSFFEYFEGLSITHGSPRQHIWTYVNGVSETIRSISNCHCAVFGGLSSPTFVDSHYFCESGAVSSVGHEVYYLSDVLWDGAGCSANSTCCSNPNLPWFYRQLNETTQDDIEVRLCTDEPFDNEAVLITSLEIFVQ